MGMFASRTTSSRRKGPTCCGRGVEIDYTPRVEFSDDNVNIYGWPSRGGKIILHQATHVDFAFLGLSTTDPPLKRPLWSRATTSEGDGGSKDILDRLNEGSEAEKRMTLKEFEEEEDAFCQRLLLLGATWWDSCTRHDFTCMYAGGMYEDNYYRTVVTPTRRERRWVKVGWEDAAAGSGAGEAGFWLLECDNGEMGPLDCDSLPEDYKEIPEDAGRILLARTMGERCEIMKKMGAMFYASLHDYERRTTFLRAWEWKWEGEVGRMEKANRRGYKYETYNFDARFSRYFTIEERKEMEEV